MQQDADPPENQPSPLTESQAAVLDRLPHCVGVYAAVRDEEGRIVDFRVDYVNDAACVSNRLTRQEQLGQRIKGLLPGHRKAGLFAAYCRVVETGNTFVRRGLEYVDACGDRVETRTLDIHAERHGDGVVATWRESAPEAGEAGAAEQALGKAQERLEIALEASGAAAWGWSVLENRVDDWTPRYRRLYGFAPDEPSRFETWLARIHPEDRDRVVKRLRQIQAEPGDDIWNEEFRILHPELGERWISGVGRCRRDENGRVLGMSGVNLDITERKRADDAHALLAAIVAGSEDAIVSKTLDGVILSWNTGAQRLFGYTAAEAVGQSINLIIPPELQQEEQSILERLCRGQRIEHFETVRVSREGRRIAISLTISPVRNETGRIVGASKVAREIGQRKGAEEALRRHLKQLHVVYRLSEAVSRAAEIEEICEAALDGLIDAVRADRASVLLFDEDGVMRFKSWRGLSEPYRAAVEGHAPWKPDDAGARPVTISDVAAEVSLGDLRETILEEGIGALAFIPLLFGQRVLGKFMVYYDGAHDFSEEELQLCQTIAGHVAYAIERAQAEQVLRESESGHRELSSRLKLLLETTSHLIESLRTEDLLPSILDVSSEIVSADAFAVWRVDDDGTWSIVSSNGLSGGFLEQSIHGGEGADVPKEAVVVQPEDLADRSNPLLRERWDHYKGEGIRSLMILPLRILDEFCGTLVFYCRSNHRFTEIEIESARALANIAASAITTSELYATESRLRRRAEEAAMREALLATVGAILSQSLDFEQTLANVAQAAVPEFADWCAVDLLDEGGVLRRLAVAHADPEKVTLAQQLLEKYPPDDRMQAGVLHVIRTGEPEMVNGIPDSLLQRAAHDEEHLSILRQLNLTSYICVPLWAGGAVHGAITFVAAESQRHFGVSEMSVAQEIARRAAHAIDNARLYRDLSESEHRLRLALDAGQMGTWQWDRQSGSVVWSAGLEEIHGLEAGGFEGTFEAFQQDIHPDQRQGVLEEIQRALQEHREYHVEYAIVLPDGSERWVEGRGTVQLDDEGEVRGMVGVCMDITERKRHEEQMRTVMAELNHRVKNTLAVIRSIAQQTMSRSLDLESFREGFDQRLQSIAKAHSLLTRTEWEGASLREIINSEVDTRVASKEQYSVSGPPVMLRPNAALAMHMVIHELTTNACKYGGLRSEAGRIDINWVLHDGEERMLELNWSERCPSSVAEPSENGYGSRLIGQLVEYELDGRVERCFRKNGLHCCIRVPLSTSATASSAARRGSDFCPLQ